MTVIPSEAAVIPSEAAVIPSEARDLLFALFVTPLLATESQS